jgi:UPF0716 protein FxsA
LLLRFGCLFVLVPLAELALLIWIGRWVGLVPTLGLVLTTGLLGAALARREGLRALTAVQSELAAGRLPGRSLMVGAAVLVGGAFLVTPGILTDIAGLLLLFPPSREIVFRWVRRRLERAVSDGTLRVARWGWVDRGGGSGEEGGGGRKAHGPSPPFPFEFKAKSGGDPEGEDGRPPRPGEIIQD